MPIRRSAISPAFLTSPLDKGLMGGGLARRWLAASECLFRQGDPTHALFIVCAGRVRLVRHAADGRVVTMHVARPGHTFAEAALFSDVYHCDAVADLPTEVAVAPKAAVRALMARDAAFAAAFATLMARHVQSLRAQIELRNVRSADDRVMAALALRIDANGEVELAGTLKDFATEIGLTHEAQYRTLKKLERAGQLTRHGARLALT